MKDPPLKNVEKYCRTFQHLKTLKLLVCRRATLKTFFNLNSIVKICSFFLITKFLLIKTIFSCL